MPALAAKDAIRALQAEIAAAVDASSLGRIAREQANLEGPSHIEAIITSDARFEQDGRMVRFRAFVELYDQSGNQYEAEIEGDCMRLGAHEWKRGNLRVIEASPLPKGG
jgi:imidazolonepropionase-like amidohydrolase